MSDTIQDLADALDLEFWFDRESLPFKLGRGRSGEQINVQTCPDCADTRYRVYLNAESGVGNCFVCNARFSKLGFVHATMGGTWSQTFSHVRDVLKDQGWRPKRLIPVAVDETKVALPSSFPLPTPDGLNLLYLERRGITGEIARYFGLRLCEEGWFNFTKDDGTRGGMNFANRVIIPVYDLDGELVTFQGRDLTGTSDRKYLFSPRLPGTGRFLLNGQNAVRFKRVVMGEGAFDVMALKIACDGESELRDIVPVGSFGKHLSYGDPEGNDQLGRFLKLKSYGLEEVIIVWDGEEKALVAALDAAKLLRSVGLRAKIARLPRDKDPNEVSADIVRRAIWEAQLYTNALDITWRLKNPYKGKSILTA